MFLKAAILIGIIGVCVALPQIQKNAQPYAVLLRSSGDVRPDGYEFGFETSDPIIRDEVGRLQQVAPDAVTLQVNGNFAFNHPDGLSQQTTFVADENGYRPKVSFGQPIGGNRAVLNL